MYVNVNERECLLTFTVSESWYTGAFSYQSPNFSVGLAFFKIKIWYKK